MLQIDLDAHRVRLDDRTVVVIDEAGMAGTRNLAPILHAADEAGAKVVLVGDPHQLPEIDAGGVLTGLAKRLEPIELTENRRQRSQWERGALPGQPTDRVGADRYRRAPHDGRRLVVLPDRRGHHRDDRLPTRRRRRPQWTRPRLPRPLPPGRRTRTRPRRTPLPSGRPDRLPQEQPPPRRLQRHPRHHRPRRPRPPNHHHHGGDRRVRLPTQYPDEGNLAHGYATTIHKTQGATVDRSLVLGTDELFRERGYVALSRGRISNHLYLLGETELDDAAGHGPPPSTGDPVEVVQQAMHHQSEKRLAIDTGVPLAF